MKIILDTDNISFLTQLKIFDKLPKLFSVQLVVLNIVESEVYDCHEPLKSEMLANIRAHCKLETFPEDNPEVMGHYRALVDLMYKGKGESACLAYARAFKPQCMASNNIKDVGHYCKTHSIPNLTICDILKLFVLKGFFSEADCNKMLVEIKCRHTQDIATYTVDESIFKPFLIENT